jgi:hypothetical protein
VRKRTFSIPDEIDVVLKKRAIDDNVRYSDVVVTALKKYLGIKGDK